MSVLYADSSALIRAYFADEVDHKELRALLLEGSDVVITSELARVELASAVGSAGRAGRVRAWRSVLARMDTQFSDGVVELVALRPEVILPAALRLVIEHRLRTLDAIHLATAVERASVLGGDEVIFVTRDVDQRTAAVAMGLRVF